MSVQPSHDVSTGQRLLGLEDDGDSYWFHKPPTWSWPVRQFVPVPRQNSIRIQIDLFAEGMIRRMPQDRIVAGPESRVIWAESAVSRTRSRFKVPKVAFGIF